MVPDNFLHPCVHHRGINAKSSTLQSHSLSPLIFLCMQHSGKVALWSDKSVVLEICLAAVS